MSTDQQQQTRRGIPVSAMDTPVVIAGTRGTGSYHAPANEPTDGAEPEPACGAGDRDNKRRVDECGGWRWKDLPCIEGFYDRCNNDGCQEAFDE